MRNTLRIAPFRRTPAAQEIEKTKADGITAGN